MKTPNNLNALRAFEAAARHLSYVAAGDELCVTPAAVGQLVRGLEDSLDVALFHRARSGLARLVLTDAARSVIPDLRAGFDHLAIAVERLRAASSFETIPISVPRSFADKWLLPRIQRFRDRHPDCDLCIDTNDSAPDRLAGRAHVGVRYGQGRWPGWEATFLFDDAIFPICHPSRVAGNRPPARPEDLRNIPLIHDASMAQECGFPTWRAWLRHAGVDGIDSERGLRIDDPCAVIAAAIAGTGVALGRRALVANDLADGRLIRPFGAPLHHEFGYYAVHRPEHAHKAGVVVFRDWLIDEARGGNGMQRRSFPIAETQIISVAAGALKREMEQPRHWPDRA